MPVIENYCLVSFILVAFQFSSVDLKLFLISQMMLSYGLNNLAYLWIWEEGSKIFFRMISSQYFFHFAFMSRHIFPPAI